MLVAIKAKRSSCFTSFYEKTKLQASSHSVSQSVFETCSTCLSSFWKAFPNYFLRLSASFETDRAYDLAFMRAQPFCAYVFINISAVQFINSLRRTTCREGFNVKALLASVSFWVLGWFLYNVANFLIYASCKIF